MKGIGPIMGVLGILAKELNVSDHSWTKARFILFFILVVGRLSVGMGVTATEVTDSEHPSLSQQGQIQSNSDQTRQTSSMTQQFQKASTDVERDSLIPEKKEAAAVKTPINPPTQHRHESQQQLPTPTQHNHQANKQLQPTHIAPPQTNRLNSSHSSDAKGDTRPKPTSHSLTTPRAIPFTPEDIRPFKVKPSTLPKAAPNRSIAKVNVENDTPDITPNISPPNAMFVPHTHNRRGRLFIRTLKNISSDIRTSSKFYNRASPLKYHRRIPRRDPLAWRRPVVTKRSPKGKPANGFVFISSVFGQRPNPFGRGTEFHNGVDLVGAKGTPILATAEGRVISRSRGRGYGIHVVVDHGSGYQTLYAHLSRKRVRVNQRVKRGQIIGYLGSTGRSTGPHLHYSVYLNRQAVDPRPYLFR